MELSYKELQEQGVFDVPYKAFELMKKQQAEICELKNQILLLKGWEKIAHSNGEKMREYCSDLMKSQKTIDKLQKGFDDLKTWILENEYTEMLYKGNTSEYVVISEYLIDELEEIKGKSNET